MRKARDTEGTGWSPGVLCFPIHRGRHNLWHACVPDQRDYLRDPGAYAARMLLDVFSRGRVRMNRVLVAFDTCSCTCPWSRANRVSAGSISC